MEDEDGVGHWGRKRKKAGREIGTEPRARKPKRRRRRRRLKRISKWRGSRRRSQL